MMRRAWGALSLALLGLPVWAQGPPSAPTTTLQQLRAKALAYPGDANVQYRLGRAYEQAGDLQAATRTYFQAHLASPTDARTMIALAHTYTRLPNYERAAYWYRKLLLTRPGDEAVTLEAARLALKHGQPLQAEILLKPCLQAHPAAVEAWLLLARTYETLRLTREAADCYERVDQLRPLTPADRRHLIALYLRTSQPQKALAQIQSALQRQPRDAQLLGLLGDVHLAMRSPAAAARAYEQAARAAPRVAEYRLKLADALAETGDEPAALREYARACDLAQPAPDLLLKVAALATRYGDVAGARRYLSLLVALLPQAVEPRELLIRTALAQGDQALALIQHRELQRGGSAESYLSEADLALRLGGRDWALGRLRGMRPALAGRPDLAARVAMILVELGETVEATGLAAEVITTPDSTAVDRALAASALLAAGETDRAERASRAIITADPRNSGAILVLARVLQARGKPAESYDLLRGGLAANPRHEELALALVGAAGAAGKLPETATFLRRMVEADAANDVGLRALAAAYRGMGGAELAARELVALAVARPARKAWSLQAADELAAAGRWKEATAFYESLVRDAEYGPVARVKLCETLLVAQRHAELLATLARVADPALVPREAYSLLTQSHLPARLQSTVQPPDLGPLARAAAALYLAPPGSEGYYLALADMCLATGNGPLGVAWLQQKTAAAGRPSPTTAGLLRAQATLGQAVEALAWLDKVDPTPLSPAAQLEQVRCLLASQRVTEAVVSAETLLAAAPPTLRGEAHLLCAEGLGRTPRHEEALWHYGRALAEGQPPDSIVSRLTTLCATSPLPEQTVLNMLRELWAAGYDDAALSVAEGVAGRPEYGGVRRWAMGRARERSER